MDRDSLSKHGIKPIIHEIARTGVIFPKLPLLVEHLVVQDVGETASGTPRQGYRLFLTDGDKRIQAVVRRRLHKTVAQMDVGRGSVIVLKEYKLATAKRLNRDGEVLYFAIADFYVIGHQPLPELVLDSAPAKSSDEHDADEGKDLVRDLSPARTHFEQLDSGREEANVDTDDGQGPQTGTAPSSGEHYSSYEEPTVPRDPEWIRRASIEHHQRCHLRLDVLEYERCPATDDETFLKFCEDQPLPNHGSPCESIAHLSLLAMMAGTPLRPFRDSPRILPLASVIGRNKSRNQDVDVLAVIVSVDASTTKPPKLSMKRDIRVQDPSVDEPVTIGIFIDPLNFRARVGTVALFRHVTTHDWRKGNLNAYPARVAGREWFIPNPHCLGLRDEISHVEAWWQIMQGETSVDAVDAPHGSG